LCRPAQKNWREENNRFILNVTRAEGAGWARAAKSLTPWLLLPISHLLLLVWVEVEPMISYKYLMTAAVGRLLLCVHDDDDDGRNPLNASPPIFILLLLIKCTHSICAGPLGAGAHSSDNKDARWMD
jgi:hypothetical protein